MCQDKMHALRNCFFADEAVIFADHCVDLQHSLNLIDQWCDLCEVSLNVNKCGVMLVKDTD